MSVRKLIITASIVLISSVAAPRSASADWLLTPFVGWNFGGAADSGFRRLHRRVREQVELRRVARLDGRRRGRIRDRLRLHAELFREHRGLDQLRVRRQQPHDVDGQRAGRRADRWPVRTGLPALRGRRRRHPQEQGRRPRGLLPRRARPTGRSTSAAARFSSSPTSSDCVAICATSDCSTTSSPRTISTSASATSSSGAARSARRSGSRFSDPWALRATTMRTMNTMNTRHTMNLHEHRDHRGHRVHRGGRRPRSLCD